LRRRLKVLSVLVSLIILISTSGLTLAATKKPVEQGNLITAIEVAGNNRIPAKEILDVVSTKVGEEISNKKLQDDLQAIFDLGYFFDVQVSFQNYKNGVKLIFEVVENPVLNKIKFKGNKVITDKKLEEILNLKTDEMLNTNQLNKKLREVESYYQDKGYILAYVKDILVKNDGTLVVSIDEGTLAGIKIKGNKKTKDFVIKRKLSLQVGDVFNVKQMQEDLRAVYNLGFFKDIKPKLEKKSSNKNDVVLTIEVEEGKTGNFGIGAGYSSADGWLGYFEVQEKNLMGRAQRLSFRWEFGEKDTYELSFFEPWVFGTETSFGFSIYDRTDEKTGTFTDENNNVSEIDYEEQEKGGSITVGHPLGFDIDGYLKYEYENTTKEALNSETTAEIPVEEREGSTRSLTFSAVRDTRDNIFNPTDGRKDRFSVKYAGQSLGGDYDFTKYQLDLRDYTPDFWFEDNSWAFRFKTGLSEGELPNHELYRIGGAQSLRGFKEDKFSGDSMALANIEYRIPIADNFTGVLFTDVGEAWKESEGQTFEMDNLKKSAGLGVRFKTPIGQLRLDYGFQKNDSRLHFSLGQSF